MQTMSDDLGLSAEFTDPNNFDAFDNEPVRPRGDKSCVCGREVARFDVYRFRPDCLCDYLGLTCEADHSEPEIISGIVGVRADGSTCCSAFEHLDEAASRKLAAEFNAREFVALSQEL